jgi:nucleoside-diphosphate-sugar epimerase
MKLLITGGGGFLGGWLARRMLARGWSVRVLDRNADRSVVEPIVGAPGRGHRPHGGTLPPATLELVSG